MSYIKTLFATLKKHRISYAGFYLFYIIAALAISASYVAAQVMTGELGQAAHQMDTEAMVGFLLLLSLILGIRAVFSALSVLFLGRFQGTAAKTFRVNFVKFFLRQPFAKLEKTNSGESLSVFTNELPHAVSLVSQGMLEVVSDGMLLVVSLVYMFYMNWLFTLIFVLFFPVLALVQMAISSPLTKLSKNVSDKRAAYNAVVNDSLQNTATVIAYSLEDELEERYMSAYREYYAAFLRQVRYYSTTYTLGFIFGALPLVFLFTASGYAVVNETMLISEFIILTGIGIFCTDWLMSLAGEIGRVNIYAGGTTKFNELLTGETESTGSTQTIEAKGLSAVRFENVSFAYGDESPTVLNGTSFEIPIGAKVAVVGGSGSGKSTILKLLLGLYEPTGGKICVLGTDASSVGKDALRNAFSYVPQDSFLFPVSICENITGKVQVSADELSRMERACKDAGILDFINTLPDKFDSVLSESAENVSGGQKQRLAMARAFYKDAPIILFDEATSALDPTTEAKILQSLEEATKDKTVIMVAHRASAKAFCDTVVTLEGGVAA